MATITVQYTFLFILSWVTFYLIYPAWVLPISVNARAFVFFALILYLTGSAYLMDRWFSSITIEKPLFTKNPNWRKHIKSNSWLLVICCIAAIMHIYPLFHPILLLGDEPLHLQGGLLIYNYIDVSWHKIFQAIFWALIALAFIINFSKNRLNYSFSGVVRSDLLKKIFTLLFFGFLVFWFFLLKDINHSLLFIRYPPVSKILYFLTYAAFGIHRIVPRIMELIFYLLCAIYLYRTINLFKEKDAAVLGAALYLFLPIPFAYAHLAELANGTVFFIVACSFYFLRFIVYDDNRDLLIATYLIGTGCLYKKLNVIMFLICISFLIVKKINKREFHSFIDLKILSISLVPIIPWMIITKIFVWRNYTFQLSNLTSLDSKIVTYLPMISSNLSEIISILLVLAVFYVCFSKRNTLTIFFGVLFIVYYFFIVSDIGYLSPRFSMAFYPTIIVFLSLFISRIIQTIRWTHAFKLFFIVLTAYLIIISAISPLNDHFLTIMNRKLIYFPSEQAMRWVKENVKAGERILIVRVLSQNFYRVKYGIDKNKIVGSMYDITDTATPEMIKEYYKKKKASYLMFPYSPKYPDITDILSYLKDNRDKEFTEIVKFNLDDAYIYIYKLREM